VAYYFWVILCTRNRRTTNCQALVFDLTTLSPALLSHNGTLEQSVTSSHQVNITILRSYHQIVVNTILCLTLKMPHY